MVFVKKERKRSGALKERERRSNFKHEAGSPLHFKGALPTSVYVQLWKSRNKKLRKLCVILPEI